MAPDQSSCVCVERTFWNLETAEPSLERRPRALSDFAVDLLAREERSVSDEASVCGDESSDRSTCAPQDSTSSSDRWADSDDEQVSMPPGIWHQDRARKAKTTKSRTGTQRLAGETLEATLDIGSRTTVVLRKLPQAWLRDSLLEFLSTQGFRERVDFAYLPMKFKKGQAFGFAIVNFCEPEDAREAMALFNGLLVDEQPISAEWSEAIQGLDSLIEKYRNSAVMHGDVHELHQPMLLHAGRLLQFPHPTLALPVPAETMRSTLLERPSAPPAECPRTTLIVRKLGRSSGVEQFMALLDQAGFSGQYDFAYVPRHFSKGTSFGFGIVNFVDESLASRALCAIEGGVLACNGQVLNAEWSEAVNGLPALLEKYRSNRVMEEGMPECFRPVVLRGGRRVPYPSQ